jgi:hypothetical protein
MVLTEVKVGGALARAGPALLPGKPHLNQGCRDNIVPLVNADQSVNSLNRVEQFLAIPLNKATGHDHPLAPPFALLGNGLGNRLMRLRPGGLKEAASVDNNYIGIGFVGGNHGTGLSQLSEHFLGVDEILGASQGNKCDAYRLFQSHFILELESGQQSRPAGTSRRFGNSIV